ncbi:MAG: ectoine/hydroxyectoine ABC transporter ATP-binding protein EhuA [Pseudomonadota bacterium]
MATETPIADGEPIIRFDKVRKCFGDHNVLDQLDLVVTRGEKLAIIGPSGSGKSTILRILMTLEPIDGGVVEIAGEPLWHLRRNGSLVPADEKHLRRMRRHIGMVFQHFNLFPHMTALGNVTAALTHVLKMPKKEAEERGVQLLHRVGLADKLNSRPSQLSGGQQQRVAIARALAMRPSIMMFDEATSALDPELVGEVLNVMRDLAHEHDLTMVIVTHQMGFAGEICDRVSFIDSGRIVEEGPPDRVLKQPREQRTQSFLRAVLDS